MRAAGLLVGLLSALSIQMAHATQPDIALDVQVEPGDTQALQHDLLAFAQRLLQPAGIHLDDGRARMLLSGPLTVGAAEIRPLWSSADATPTLPLTFLLTSRATVASDVRTLAPRTEPIIVTLAVPLLRDVWVAQRRLRKGSALTCADLGVERRELRKVSQAAVGPCEIEAEAVALHDIAAKDMVREGDIGRAPEVMAGAPVRLRVASGGISVTTTAIALSDARTGDRIDVRLQHPTRTLSTRVIGPGSVELQEAAW